MWHGLKKVWLLIKRIIFFLLSVLMFMVGVSAIVSGLVEAYGPSSPWWMALIGFTLGMAALALGYLIMRYIVFGSDRDVAEADINPGDF